MGSSGTAPRNRLVFEPPKSNPEYLLPTEEAMGTIFTVLELNLQPTSQWADTNTITGLVFYHIKKTGCDAVKKQK